MALLTVLLGLAVRVALSGRDVSQTFRFPAWIEARVQRDEVAYPAHVLLARGFGLVGASPVSEGVQWLKAAAHAASDEQFRTIGAGLRSALARTDAADYDTVATLLCDAARRGSQVGHSLVVALSGLDCNIEQWVLGHVPESQPVYYRHNPPIGGPHYASSYPSYGVLTSPVAPGYWVHNLEHGAIVLLYRCGDDCPRLVAELEALYRALPGHPSTPNGAARLLAIPAANLPAHLALVTWGDVALLDQFDAGAIRAFYEQNVGRGPECHGQSCPP